LWPRATTHPNLTQASGSLQSIRGAAAVDWAVTSASFSLRATVPANAVAEVRLPFPPETVPSSLLATDGAPPHMCDSQPEGSSVFFSCPAGETVVNVSFASYGTPTGRCRTGFQVGACNSPNSVAVVSAACMGLNSCSVGVSDANFGDPCNGTPKKLSSTVVCSGQGSGVIFANGSFVPGVKGVVGARIDANSSTLSISVGSGEFALTLLWE
jgi:hypothetical protein